MKVRCPACCPDAGKPGWADCERCKGKGKIQVAFRFADVMTPTMDDFLATFRFFHGHGVLPEPGGLHDQPATWIDAVGFLEGRLSWVQEDREARRPKPKRK